ncbi:hypothetical protein [Bartonella sp. B1098]|uniref:hypothetical protein n=1 Tax=Bartonella sp. B1098 TaxID=2911421 RepID=UPI0020C1E5E7|nr:hypothetical protein [Bartonella sp. B1098]
MGQGRLEVIELVAACDTGRCSVERGEASRVCAGGGLVNDAIKVSWGTEALVQGDWRNVR